MANYISSRIQDDLFMKDMPKQLDAMGYSFPGNADYVQHVANRANISTNILKAAFSYLEKIPPGNQPHTEKQLTFATSVMLAHKYLEDSTYSLVSWSRGLGYDKKTLGEMERNMLNELNHNLT